MKKLAFVVFVLLLTLVTTLHSAQASYQNYQIQISTQPSNMPWEGYYTTQDTIQLLVVVTNLSKVSFEGGNLTGTISSPTGKWTINLNNPVPKLDPVGLTAFLLSSIRLTQDSTLSRSKLLH